MEPNNELSWGIKFRNGIRNLLRSIDPHRITEIVLDRATASINGPPKERADLKELWENLNPQTAGHDGKWIGWLEQVIGVIAALSGHYEFIGGYLVFKVASKWEVYSNIVKIPDQLADVEPKDFFFLRKRLAGLLYSRFVLGTSTNIIIGVLIGYIISFIFFNSVDPTSTLSMSNAFLDQPEK